MATLFVDKLDPQSGTALEIGTSGDTITIPSGATLDVAGTLGSGLTNAPYFAAKLDSDQTISDVTTTKVAFESVILESSGSVFDLVNDKFTVVTAGKYLITASVNMFDATNKLKRGDLYVYKNGAKVKKFTFYDDYGSGREYSPGGSFLMDLSASDYLEMYVYGDTTDNGDFVLESDDQQTMLQGIKILT